MFFKRPLFAWFGVVTLSLAAIAQNSTSSLRGQVTDATGAAIVGTELSLSNPATGWKTLGQSDAAGEYRFYQLPAGLYELSARAKGFAAQTRKIELLVNQPATVNFSLGVGVSEASVEVTGEAREINYTDATMGDAVDSATVLALPMEGRNVPDLLSLQPGVLFFGSAHDQTNDSRSGAVSGGRSDQGNLTLDGIDNNGQLYGYAFTGVLRSTLDSVDEFRVTTVGMNADSGRSSGSQVSVVTRGGSNRLHGSLYQYNRSNIGYANDWFNKQAELGNGLANRPGELIRNTFGAAAGGPIKKDKIFFFVNYEGQRTNENQQTTRVVPTASMRAGSIRYIDSNGVTQTIDSGTIAQWDTNNGVASPGPDAAVLSVLNLYPKPNSLAAGDGLNTATYTWSAPNPAALNTYIARFDYNFTPHNWLFVRGNLQNDKTSEVPEFPGQPPSSTNFDNSKGMAVADTWTMSPRLVNTIRYGFTRQGTAARGIGNNQFVGFYGIDTLDAESHTTLSDVPVHNLVDDLTWTHQSHTLQAGINYRLIYNHRQSDALNWSYGATYYENLLATTLLTQGGTLNPATYGMNPVAGSFSASYDTEMTNLLGLVTDSFTEGNYVIDKSGSTGSLLPQGAMTDRTFKNNEFEYYLQDSWRLRPRLTVNFGLRHSLLQTPYEVNGQQLQPTVDIAQWFETREAQAALGNTVQPNLSFAPSGQARGLKPFWDMNKFNIAPRVAIAWSPAPREGFWQKLFGGADKSSIRASYGIYYDHFGQGIVNSFDQNGEFGLTESLPSPCLYDATDAPRFTGMNSLPTQLGFNLPSTVTYPLMAPDTVVATGTDISQAGFQFTHGLFDHIQTPYAHVVNLSLQRELPGKFMMELSYIGRFGRHQLVQLDLTEPLDLVYGGQDYFSAMTVLDKAYDAGTPVGSIKPIPLFEHFFPAAIGGGLTATQNIYNTMVNYGMRGSETMLLYYYDALGMTYNGNLNYSAPPLHFWQPQYSSLYAWTSIGTSNYNAGQISLVRRMSRGLQMELNYTFAKSMDDESDAERSVYVDQTPNASLSFSAILNTEKPSLNYGPSDFDVRHMINGNFVAELPFGHGRRYFSSVGRAVDAVIGNWQLSGVGRWTSGLPFSISGNGWGTDWDQKSLMVQTGPIETQTHIDANGQPEVFANPAQALQNLRIPYAGEAGDRNNFRGDGYFGIDASLSKNWVLAEGKKLVFDWAVFNVTNAVRFDVSPNSLQTVSTNGQFGVYGATLTKPRVMQFGLRYQF